MPIAAVGLMWSCVLCAQCVMSSASTQSVCVPLPAHFTLFHSTAHTQAEVSPHYKLNHHHHRVQVKTDV